MWHGEPGNLHPYNFEAKTYYYYSFLLPKDKGVAMVVMDKQDYINKSNQLLNQNTYKVISKDPTNTIKNKLINILKGIKTKQV